MEATESTKQPRQRSMAGKILRHVLFLPFRSIGRKYQPVPIGLALVNLFFQRILDLNSQLPWMVHFTNRVTGEITIGRNVWISFAVSGGCYIQGRNGIFIDDDTIIAPNVSIVSANHSQGDLTSWDECEPVRIGKRCWIGTQAVILPGVELGDDVVVAAGSVVTKSFPDRSVIAGVPARLLRSNEGS